MLVDPAWWNAVWNTFRFAVVSVSIETVLGLMVALVLNAEFKGRGLVRAAILIPWAIPTIVSAKMWALDAQRPVRHHQRHAAEPRPDRPEDRLDRHVDTAMSAVLIVDVWKTTPFMALLILAGLQMIPRDIYEAAKIDGIHPVKVFFKVTLPLVKPALMVAVIFRLLDALRIFDLIYVLTPNSDGDQDHVGHQPREPDRLRQVRLRLGAVDAAVPDHRAVRSILYIWLGRVDLGGEKQMMPHGQDTALFYLAVVLIVVVAVFPFYYAILTSFKTGTALFQVNYWPTAVQPATTTSPCSARASSRATS